MYHSLRLLKWLVAVAVVISGNFAKSDDLSRPTHQMDFFQLLDPPPLQPSCTNDLVEVYHPSWTGALRELNGQNEAPFFAKASSRENNFSQATKAKLREAGFWVAFNPEGYVELSKDGHTRRVVMTEPVSSVDFFLTPQYGTEFPDDDAFIVILGWTQVNYYRYHNGHWLPSNEGFFKREIKGAIPNALQPYQVTVEDADHGEVAIVDPAGRKLYQSSKVFHNLLDHLHLSSRKELDSHFFVNRLRAENIHLLSLYLEGERLGDHAPATVAQIFTQAANAIAQLKNPDFSPFFSPLVEKAFQMAFRTDNYGRFTAHFGDFVNRISNKNLTLVPLGDATDTSNGEPVMRFRSNKTGREYIVYYLFSSRDPLRIMAVGS